MQAMLVASRSHADRSKYSKLVFSFRNGKSVLRPRGPIAVRDKLSFFSVVAAAMPYTCLRLSRPPMFGTENLNVRERKTWPSCSKSRSLSGSPFRNSSVRCWLQARHSRSPLMCHIA